MSTLRYFPLALLTTLFASCGMNSNLVNHFTTYGNGTMVELKEANYRVVGQVTGQASDIYVLSFGGFKANLVEQAKQDMLKKAEMDGKARAVVNVGMERHLGNYLLARKLTVTMTGTVVEFTK